MPVPRTVLKNGVGIIRSAMMDGEGLAQQLFCQGTLDLHRDDAFRVGVQTGNVYLRPLRFRPELGDQLVIPGPVARNVDIDILPVQEQIAARARPAKGKVP